MSTALELTAGEHIRNGHGLSTSPVLSAEISTFQSKAPIVYLANIFANANSSGNVSFSVLGALSNLGSSVTNGSNWLIDFYPGNVTPTCSANVTYYGVSTTPIYDSSEPPVQTGTVSTPVAGTQSLSRTFNVQAQLPFAGGPANGIQRFANVYQTASSYVSAAFDITSSSYLLRGKTYAQTGVGFTGVLDSITNGIGTTGNILGRVVENWGTLYDINNISAAGDPYIFGQNLLNQGLGTFGNLETQLVKAGLNIYNLSQIPTSTTVTSQEPSVISSTSPLGAVDLPIIANVTTTTTVTGNSRDVILSIFDSITGQDLVAILGATNASVPGTGLTKLTDYLNIEKVAGATYYAQLAKLGITDFSGFTSALGTKLGRGYFTSWNDISNLFSQIVVPELKYSSSSPNDLVLPSSVSTSITNRYGVGSGPFENPVLTDFIGAVSGIPYTSLFKILNDNYDLAASQVGLTAKLATLNSAVTTYINQYAPPDGMGGGGSYGDIAPVTAAINSINSALNSITIDPLIRSAFYTICNKLATEVTNCTRAGIVFNNGFANGLDGFAKSISSAVTSNFDSSAAGFFTNLFTNDSYGDTMRAMSAESTNTSLLNSKGILTANDPDPAGKTMQAKNQNIPLTTYLSQNK